MLKAFAAKQVKVCPTKGNQRRQQRVACGKQQQQQLRQGKSMSRFCEGYLIFLVDMFFWVFAFHIYDIIYLFTLNSWPNNEVEFFFRSSH